MKREVTSWCGYHAGRISLCRRRHLMAKLRSLRFVNRVSVREKINSGEGMVGVEPLRYHYSAPVIELGKAA